MTWLHSLVWITMLFSSPAVAGGLDVLTGTYRIEADTSNGSASLSNFGLVKMSYHLGLSDNVSLRPGYSIYVFPESDTDIGYGLDIALLWYPLSTQPYALVSHDSIRLEHEEIYRPFIALSFHQRQYQSIQSSYAGVGLTLGLERGQVAILPTGMYFSLEVAVLYLEGPLNSTINESQLVIGVGKQL